MRSKSALVVNRDQKTARAKPSRKAVDRAIPGAPISGLGTSLQRSKDKTKHSQLKARTKRCEWKNSSFRFRCAPAERERWHQIAFDLTGQQSNLSLFTRAAFLLIEHAYSELAAISEELKMLKRPAKKDVEGLAYYERQLASLLLVAFKTSPPSVGQ
jgi:hypothetical protein